MHGTMRPDWFPDWSAGVCAVIGSGQSATQEDVDKMRGRCRVLVVNNNYQLAPWADALYACDGRWWEWHKEAVAAFQGLKITYAADQAAHLKLKRIDLVEDGKPETNVIALAPPGTLGRGGNGAFQAINLAVQFGARRLLLLGIDYTGSRWHGSHPMGRPQHLPQRLEEWRGYLDGQADLFRSLGVEVVNCSMQSALTKYPKMSVEAALERWGA